MSWILLQIGSMLLSSISSVLDKRMVHEYEPNPILYLASFAVVGLPVSLVGIVLVPWVGLSTALLGILSGSIFTAAVFLYYQAIRLEEVSRLVPILRLSSVVKLLLLAVFLQDRLMMGQYAAFACMMVGTLALNWKNETSSRTTWSLSRGVLLMGCAAVLLAVEGVIEGHLNLTYSPWIATVWSNVGTVISMGLLLCIPAQRRLFLIRLRVTTHRFRVLVLGEQTGRFVTGVLGDWAIYTAGSAAITSVISSLNPLLVLILAVTFLGERFNRQEALPKLAGVGLMGIGTGLLLLG